MSSNYPPGVTGAEYAISGPDREVDEHRTCKADSVSRYTLAKHDGEALMTFRGSMGRLVNSMRQVRDGKASVSDIVALDDSVQRMYLDFVAATRSLEFIEFDTCPFDDDVTVQYYRGTSVWTCPLCGTEHEDSDD